MSQQAAVREHEQEQNPTRGNGHAPQTGGNVLPVFNIAAVFPSVVTLAFLSEHLPCSLLAEGLTKAVVAESGASAVLVRLEGAGANGAASNGSHAALEKHGGPVPASALRQLEGFPCLTIEMKNGAGSPARIDSLLSRLSRSFRFVLIELVVNGPPAPWAVEFLRRSQTAYLFLRPETQDVYHLDLAMRELRAPGQSGKVRAKPIACLGEAQEIDGFDMLVQRVAGPVHAVLHGCPTGDGEQQTRPGSSFQKDVRRLAREIGGCQLGLALSSGAAKGFAHVGVIQVLEENGIEVDIVAGASMGAYVGALWASGREGGELEKLSREMERRWALWTVVDPVFPPRRGFVRGYAVKKRLMRSIGRARFADLARPLRVVAGNLATLDRVVFSSGEVAAAVHASIAVPGVCVPVTIDGETYIDGGIVDPLPVDVLREMGVSRIIAVDVIPTPDRIRCGLQAEEELARHRDGRALKWLRRAFSVDQKVNYFARGNVFEILMRSLYGAQIRLAAASSREADLVLRPDICDNSWLDFRMPGKFIALGREAAERHLDEIKALVASRNNKHEQAHAPTALATVA